MTVTLQMPARGEKRATKRDAEKLAGDFVGQLVKLGTVRRTPLLNRDRVRKFLLEFAREARPFNKFSRVSEDTLEQVNAGVRQFCQNLVRRKPSKGVTL